MPAVMPRAGFLTETFAPINTDCMGSHSNVLSLESVLGEHTRRVSGCQHATLGAGSRIEQVQSGSQHRPQDWIEQVPGHEETDDAHQRMPEQVLIRCHLILT